MAQIRRARIAFAVLMIISGVLIFSYPFIGNYFNTRNATVAVEDYRQQVADMEQEDIDALKKAAEAYNRQVSSAGDGSGSDGGSYRKLIDMGSAIGYITIPAINLNLPIYEGTDSSVLERGIGHITETGYPLGGEGNHSALSGHRGMADAELFVNLDRLEIGSRFFLHVLDEVLAYEVDQVKVVEPDDVRDLEPVAGADLCTLVTCTPKGINSHRMLVRGQRVPYTGEDDGARSIYQSVHTGTAMQRWLEVWPWLALAAIFVLCAEAMLMITVVGGMRRRMEED